MNSLFPMVKFTDEEVNSFKIRQAKKNEKFKFNNLERKVDTRWIGMACEEGLKVLLDSKGIKYVYHADDNKIDDQDFTIGEFEIDVKSVSTSYYPKTHYACNIPDHQ